METKSIIGRVFLAVLITAVMAFAGEVTVRVVDSDGAPIEGATIAYGGGSNPSAAYFQDDDTSSSQTDSAGEVTKTIPDGTYSFQARYHNGHANALSVAVSGDTLVEFQTVKYTLTLEECDTRNGIAGQQVAYGAGTNTNTSWAGSTDGDGKLAIELFPGVYSFNVYLNGTSKAVMEQVVEEGGWNKGTVYAVKVLLDHSGPISYGGGSGQSAWYSYGMYMLPGTIQFRFSGVHQQLYISGCPYAKVVAIVKVLASDDSGDEVSARVYWYNHGNAGDTKDVGNKWGTPKVVLIDADEVTGTNVVFKVTRNNVQNSLNQNIFTNSIYCFQTVAAYVQVLNHKGVPQVGQLCEYYGWGAAGQKFNGWFGGSDLLEIPNLLPGSYGFILHHNNTTQGQQPVAIPDGNLVTFQTGLVTDGAEFDCVQYYQWGNAGNKANFWDGKELLPVKVVFIKSGGGSTTLDPVPVGAETALEP